MRILIVTSPGIGHLFPTVPTAWALRAAGHDVLVASSGNVTLAGEAGLPAVDTAPGTDFRQVFTSAFGELAEYGGPDGEADRGPTEEYATRLFAKVSAPFVDRTVALARRWRPDVVLSTPLQGAGPIAAAAIDVPYVVHGISMGQTSVLWEGVADHMADTYQRLDVKARPEAGVLSVTPPGLGVPGSVGWPMRYLPYNGGAVLPSWLFEPRERRRVAVTLGTVVPLMGDLGILSPLVAAAETMDVEFVLALGDADPSSLGELPANVHALGWLPINALFAVSDAVIHHGGAGTTMTAMTAGIPEIVMPQAADQFLNAGEVAKAGIGTVTQPDGLTVEMIDTVLSDTGMRAAAELVAGAIATQPTPAELVGKITGVAG